MTTADAPPAGSPYAAWERQVVWWDLGFALIVTLTGVALPLDGVRGTPLLVAYAALATLVVAYVAAGGPAARTRDQRRARAYVAVMVAGVAVVVGVGGGTGTFLLFIGFTHVWMLLEPVRHAIVGCVVLGLAVTVALSSTEGFEAAELARVAPQMGVALVFAVGLGLWTSLTMRRADEHARLVGELRAAQAELAASNHAAGVAAERERMAREIHDTLAQGFTSVVTQAQAAIAALDRGEHDAARERLRLVESTARENLAEARALVAAFAPVPLQNGTLAEALRRLADRFAAETGIAVRLEVADDGTGGPAVPAGGTGVPRDAASDVVLLRAAQEALANVRRHADARAVTVRLDRDAGTVGLEVTDDGRGLPPGHADGIGLSGMRERVSAVGGSIDVGPGDRGGTRVRVRVPVAGGA
ncbi:sensor histidine kinase [Isoptericola variabilis]|uniref:histidine kinase n=1 Tax=Isoptericola variabilis (strain 225) TaxID=743718 RepID=F6FVU4_ISOV2|nr:sensor histidine kinase [Isoptericola variabilis]AEG43424.1 putative signal transduction histidine kinase [Isoptericola variabilis 225]